MSPHADDYRQQNAIDRADIEQEEIARLLERYRPMIEARCNARMRNRDDAADVAQDVQVRLLREFRNGNRWTGVPFRAVVARAIDWTLKDHWASRPTDTDLPADWPLVDTSFEGSFEQLIDGLDFLTLIADLPDRERDVMRLSLLDGLSHDQIATELGITSNNVAQALFRAIRRLAELQNSDE